MLERVWFRSLLNTGLYHGDPWGEVPDILNPPPEVLLSGRSFFPNRLLPLPTLSISKQEPAALETSCWFPTCCCEAIAVASCYADKTGAACGGSLIFLELFPLQKEAAKSPAQQMLLEGCATAENG